MPGNSVDRTKIDSLWWGRSDLGYRGGALFLAGESLEHVAHSAGKPVFVYSAGRIEANLNRLRRAMTNLGRRSRVLYAMKANRYPPLLEHLRSIGLDGLDVCSPGELQLARQTGFPEETISFTATSVSNTDLDVLAAHPAVWVNCDSLSSIRRLGERSPGREIGLRINQRAGLGYGDNEQLRYSGDVVTKFGIYREQMDEALALANRFGLEVRGLHFHAGCGYLDPQLPEFRAVLEGAVPFLEKVPGIQHINLGGGLGVPIVESDEPLDLSAWTATVSEVLGKFPGEIWIEPGDYLVKDAGVLVLEVNTVEEKGGCCFVGVNGGFNLHIEPAFYDLPLHITPCRLRGRSEPLRKVTVVGNINEALDVFAADIELPRIEEGDYLAFLNAGGYGSSMSSNHCLRGDFAEYLIVDNRTENRGETSMTDRRHGYSEQNKQAWDSLYGETEGEVWGRDPIPFVDEFIKGLGDELDDGANLLDAAAGEGRHLPLLLGLPGQVYATDASSNALTKMAALVPGDEYERIRCDLERTPFADDFFDLVLLIDTIETLPNVDDVLGELCRVLKPGGHLLCNIPGKEDGISSENMEEMAAGDAPSFLYQGVYFYRFYTEREALELIRRNKLEVRWSDVRTWTESPHPGFRNHEHSHTSRIFLLEKPKETPVSH